MTKDKVNLCRHWRQGLITHLNPTCPFCDIDDLKAEIETLRTVEPMEEVTKRAKQRMMMNNQVTVLPDGSAFAVANYPLPKNHWLTAEGHNVPPMPLRMGTDNPERQAMNQKVWAAAKYAVRSATMNGKELDFDPDALCQNMVVGLLGYHTADGLSSDSWENPPQVEPGA